MGIKNQLAYESIDSGFVCGFNELPKGWFL
jgi:hypothetical protein